LSPPFTPADAQAHFAATIVQGPAACPTGLFAGTAEQVLRGLKVHANTISHARLVALEDSFPRTRAALGHENFLALSHGYIDAGHGRAQSLDRMGEGFARFLQTAAVAPLAVALAGFEWLWLESYHAAEAAAFTAAELAAHLAAAGAAGLGELRLRHHPAAQLMPLAAGLAEELNLPTGAGWLLIARPDAEVLIHTIDEATAALFALLPQSPTFFAAIETFALRQPDNDPLPALQLLLAAGVLTRGED
jgi:hypothetical protein